MSSDRSRRLTSALVLALTFVLGGATGAGLYASFGHRPHFPRGQDGRRHLPPPFEELDLTAEQRTKAEAIFEKYRPQFDAVFQASMPKMNELRAQMNAELEPVLTEAQREKLKTLHARHPMHRGEGGPPPPPPQPPE